MNAQDTLTLSLPITTGGVIKGCKGIRVQPGFSFTASANNSLSLKVDVSVCNDQEIPVTASSGQNYIMTVTPMGKTKSVKFDNGDIVVDRTTEGDVPVQVSIQYYDGLGRLVETVQKGIVPRSGDDLVTIQEYDNAGRESKIWLPTPYAGSGSYVDSVTINSKARTAYADNSPYSSPVYEASPLNRALEKYGPGDSWRFAGRSVKSAFLTNDNSIDSLRCAHYYVTSDNKLVKSDNYDNCQLYVTRTMDEDNHKAFEFKDKLGQVVLTRQINNNQNHDTYYVYDDFGNKCFVLPPSTAAELTDNTYTGAEDLLVKFAYIYKYDYRNRCIYKKLPGADPIYMIYDMSDHLIFSQDGEQRKRIPEEWSFNIPDAFGRTVLTGVCKNSLTYNANPLNGIVVMADWTKTTTDYKGYTITGTTLSSPTILDVNYYDSYEFMGLNGIPSITDLNFKPETGTGYGEQYTGGYKGQLTGKITALLDGSSYLYNVMYYDDRGQVVQTKATNHLTGGYEKDYFLYTFTGKVKKHLHIHGASGKTTIAEVYENFYDNAERLTKTTHSLNGADPVTLAENTYDEMGRLSSKKQHGAVETTNYAYNIRSWLKSINTASRRFSEALYYNESSNGSILCYNGNISAMTWKLQNDTQRGYNFHYDDLSRITAADYQNNDVNSNKNYSTSYAYDKMGNIKNLTRLGLSAKPSTFGVIDDLTLSYDGNQLSSVSDASTSEPSYSGAFNFVKASSGTPEYTYDSNGNLTRDSHKKIARIQYNILNLPSGLQFTEGHTTEYLYDAAGVKRSVKQVTTTENLLVPMGSMLPVPADKVAVTTQTDYCGNVIYENGTLSRILVDDGYITMNGITPTYHYYIQDHQGNNRVAFNQNGTIEQTNHYYPFGMTFGEGTDNSDNRYKYNGKELDRMHGLDLYDYSARMQDGMRFTTIDPLAEKYYSVSPYAYCLNNPVRYIDPNGMWPTRKVVDNGSVGKRGFTLMPVVHPVSGSMKRHLGQDFRVALNNKIHSLAEGRIDKIGNQFNKKNKTGWGWYVDVRHSDGFLTRYCHLTQGSIMFKVGDKINNGEVIALSGMSGGVTGPHLHLEMYQNGKPIDPISILDLQEMLYGQSEYDNKDNPIELEEVVVTGKKINTQKSIEDSIPNLDGSVENKNGNTGTYNQKGRLTDAFYSDDFLKWYYNDTPK